MRRTATTDRAARGAGAVAGAPGTTRPRRRRRRLTWLIAVLFVLGAAGVAWYEVHQQMPGWYARMWYPLEHEQALREEAARNGLDPALVAAVIDTESGFAAGSRSAQGAVGLMQVQPDTARFVAGLPRPAGPLARPHRGGRRQHRLRHPLPALPDRPLRLGRPGARRLQRRPVQPRPLARGGPGGGPCPAHPGRHPVRRDARVRIEGARGDPDLPQSVRRPAPRAARVILNHAQLVVADLAASRAFYARWFGLTEAVHDEEGFVILRDPAGGLLALREGSPAPGTGDGFHLGFQVERGEDVVAFRERARAAAWRRWPSSGPGASASPGSSTRTATPSRCTRPARERGGRPWPARATCRAGGLGTVLARALAGRAGRPRGGATLGG